MKSLITPDPAISYGFLAAVYAVLTLLALALWAAEKQWTAVTGFWLVPAPALPCLMYALLLRSRVLVADNKKTS